MKTSKEVYVCKKLFYRLGRLEKQKIIENSNLDDREQKVLTLRFIEGATTQETAVKMNMTDDALSKMQRRIFKKIYVWLSRYTNQNGFKLDSLINSEILF